MVSIEELDRIASVEHPDPHSVLGAHEEDGALVVRAFRPDAVEVRVLADDGSVHPMQRVHSLGVFEARLSLPSLALPAAGAPILGRPAGPRPPATVRLPSSPTPRGEGQEMVPSPPSAPHFSYRLEVRYPKSTVVVHDPYAFPPSLGELDLHLAAEGTHLEIYRHLGAHVREIAGVRGTSFAVWAPSAQRVSVTGDFSGWDGRLYAMRRMGRGIWEIFLPGVGEGALYKFEVKTLQGPLVLKSDPYGRAMELRPRTASKVYARRYEFTDAAWMAARASGEARRRPLAIYEVHLGSWRRRHVSKTGLPITSKDPAAGWLSYRELATLLVDYVADMGFTHIELLPVMEHPYDGSWGYQVSGYFAPTSRYGDPDDFRYFVDRCHARGIGVILDWTPAHFPKDAFALGRFDGSALYEHLDPRQGEHRQWQTFVFNYGRPEVRNFLISNALYWLDEFHVDGLRVDAVASMLYLDYGASHPGEWVPNRHGGRENLEAIAFLRELCDRVHEKFPGAVVCAEESTAWPGVTRPTYVGGLGFDFKWNMGWMHDTLDYFEFDPIHRAFHHGKLTFSLMYAFAERFLLPLSHDEVVHLKKSMLSKMPGDRWKMHANLRALYAYMWAHPGKKLLFMGGEIGQYTEWNFEGELDWSLLDEPDHKGLQRAVRDINTLYKRHPALYEVDDEWTGFRWIDCNDAPQSVLAFVRFPLVPAGRGKKAPKGTAKGTHVVCVTNFTPIARHGYRVGVPRRCRYLEVLNTDAEDYGGSGVGNFGAVEIEKVPSHGFGQSITLTLPPLAVLWLVPVLDEDPPEQQEEEAAAAAAAAAAAKEKAAREAGPSAEPPQFGVPSIEDAEEPSSSSQDLARDVTLVSRGRKPAS